MEYDIEIMLPVSGTGKYLQRLLDFKKYGFKNITNQKIKLVLLTGTDKIIDIDKNWHENIDVFPVSSVVNHHAAKVHDYYSKKTEFDAKWYMRLDDDSYTNIDLMMSFLNPLDHNNNYYFITETCVGEIDVDVAVLKKLNLFDKVNGDFAHEIEASIISQNAMKQILTNETANNILAERAKIEAGFTDIMLTLVAKIVGIFPFQLTTMIPGMTCHPLVSEFRNGNKFHIHKIARDINQNAHELMNVDVRSCYFVNKPLFFGRFVDVEIPEFIHIIKLLPDGCIYSKSQLGFPKLEHEVFWSYDEEKNMLKFLNKAFIVTSVFENFKNDSKVKFNKGVFRIKKGGVLLPPCDVFIKGLDFNANGDHN